MPQGVYTPLQIMAAAAMVNNQGIKPLPSALTTAINTYQNTTVISNWLAAINFYQAQSWKTQSTLDQLLAIGSTVCPALGNSIPAPPLGDYPFLVQEYLPGQSDASTIDPYGFAQLVQQTGDAYLGQSNNTTDLGKFSQGFVAVQGYINNINTYINSSVNAQTYLGPTFTTMSNLITNNISAITNNLPAFGVDLVNQGQLTNLKQIELYGTPAGLLQQLSAVGGIRSGTIPALRDELLALGVSKSQIADIVNNNIFGLFNPNGLSTNEFNSLQKLLYTAMTKVKGADLDDVLQILDITLPNIETMADLINPVKIFPNSYTSLRTPTSNGYEPIYDNQNQVNMNLQPEISALLPAPTGCDELSKIIPPDQAVANKAIQVALSQITGITNTTLPDLASTVDGYTRRPWDIEREYLTNDLVANATDVNGLAQLTLDTEYYRAQQEVPAGVQITNTSFWKPTVLTGLNTVGDLQFIDTLTGPVSAATVSYIENFIATGSGPNGTLTTCDVLGTAIDYNNFALQFGDATTIINSMQSAGTLNSLNSTFVSMLSAANDAAMLALITTANNDIVSIAAADPANVAALNVKWTYIASYLNDEKTYQTQAGIDYFVLQANEKTSIYSFVQNLEQWGTQPQSCGPYDFLEYCVDTQVLGGQAIIGALREGANQARMSANKLGIANVLKPPSTPPLIPSAVISPATE